MGLTIDQAAEEGGISPVTWSRVELGRNVRRLTYSTVDTVLKWGEGASLDFLEQGIEPKGTVHGRAEARLGFEAQAQGAAPDEEVGPLAGLPEGHDERIAELSKRLDRNAEEQQQISAELARLFGRTDQGESRETG